VFTARYAPSLYIKQMRFVFKGLIIFFSTVCESSDTVLSKLWHNKILQLTAVSLSCVLLWVTGCEASTSQRHAIVRTFWAYLEVLMWARLTTGGVWSVLVLLRVWLSCFAATRVLVTGSLKCLFYISRKPRALQSPKWGSHDSSCDVATRPCASVLTSTSFLQVRIA
jgi:hypothetical protein